MWVFLNGSMVEHESACISVFDHGFLYGDGVFETLRAYGGRIFLLNRHLERLRRSCALIGLEFPTIDKGWSSVLREVLRRNNLEHAHIRISISRGVGELGMDPSLCSQPTIVVMAKPITMYQNSEREHGVDLILTQIRRNSPTALPPQIKALSFLNNILAKQEAIQAGAFDGILLNWQGHLTECTTSNIFFIRSGALYTPSVDCGILDGITREVVLLLSQEHGIAIREGHFTPDVLLEAEECFLTNTSMEILPVRQIGSTHIGRNCPGSLTRHLCRLFKSNLPRFLNDPFEMEGCGVAGGSEPVLN